MRVRQCFARAATAAAAVLIFTGCGPDATPSDIPPDALPAAPRPVEATGDLPIRLARVEHRRSLEEPREPRTLRLEDATVHQGGASPTEEGLRLLPNGPSAPRLEWVLDPPVDALEYNRLRVRVKAEAGHGCHITWISDVARRFESHPGTYVPLFPDGAFHTYTLSLSGDRVPAWTGKIPRLLLTPADAAAPVEVESVELAWDPPEAPLRISIDNRTHEALPATVRDYSWRVKVPPQARFTAGAGIVVPEPESPPSEGVRFIATIETPDGSERVLFDRVLEPGTEDRPRPWVAFEADLSEWAEQVVTLNLRTEQDRPGAGAYAYWGNPLILPARRDPEDIPVILISCDTLRADHLSCYGYERETTPFLDSFAREAVLFENAVTQYVWTPASHMTMLTGLYPERHGVDHTTNLAESDRTLAEILSDRGYLSAGFTGHTWWFLPSRGFAHGFDVYDIPTERDQGFRDVFESHALLQAWYRNHPTSRLFLFAHNYDIHSKFPGGSSELPYDPPRPEFRHFSKELGQPPAFKAEVDGVELTCTPYLVAAGKGDVTLDEEQRRYLVALYDDCVRAVDEAIRQFMDALKAEGLYDQALIIVTSDHGEDLGEQDRYMHESIYETCARVPLLVKFPKGAHGGRRVSDPVQLVDLFPTVLETLGITDGPSVDGQSLLSLLTGRDSARTWTYVRHDRLEGVRGLGWKFHRATRSGKELLFNLLDDPWELKDLAPDDPPELALLRTEWEQHYRRDTGGWHFGYAGDDAHSDMTLQLGTDDRFRPYTLIQGDWGDAQVDEIVAAPDGRSLTAHLVAIPRDWDDLVVPTASPDGRVTLRIIPTRPFLLRLGDETREVSGPLELSLDPAAVAAGRPADLPPSPVDRPILVVWREESVARTSAEDLSDDALEQLKSLGYFQ